MNRESNSFYVPLYQTNNKKNLLLCSREPLPDQMQRPKNKAVKMLFLPLLTGNTTRLKGSRTVGEREAKLNWILEQRAVIKRSILRSPQTSGSAVAPASGLLVRMPLGAAQRQSRSTEDTPGGSTNDTCRIQTYKPAYHDKTNN